MTRADFERFVEEAIEDVIRLAEARAGKPISRRVAFQWMGAEDQPIHEGIPKLISDRVFVAEDQIYPCVDLGVLDILHDGTPLVVAAVAGYPPEPFGRNWTGREGPFVRIIGTAFLHKMTGKPWAKETLIHFISPDMYDEPK